jgi:predicted transposase/invertase (TIGR01784 family)
MQNNLTASTAILAGLVLEQEVIQRLLKRDTMRELVIYQMIKDEGLQEGKQEGSQQKAREIALNLIAEGMAIETIARITSLTVEVVQQL